MSNFDDDKFFKGVFGLAVFMILFQIAVVITLIVVGIKVFQNLGWL